MDYTHPEYLIFPQQLNAAIESGSERLRIFDVTVNLVPNPPGYKAVSGLEAYEKAHIPGAVFLDLLVDLSDTNSPFGFTLPSAEQLESAYRKAGINHDSQIVIYSTGHMMWATRVWWMLHSCGHKNVAVLDGGFEQWRQEENIVTAEDQSYPEGDFTVDFNSGLWANKARVLETIGDAEVCTINALSPGVYSGEAEMHYGRRGHIENSENIYYGEILDNGCFKSADDLNAVFSQKGILEKAEVISYCGGGISATIDGLALLLIGYQNVSIYDGSMTEWVRDESLPMATGPD